MATNMLSRAWGALARTKGADLAPTQPQARMGYMRGLPPLYQPGAGMQAALARFYAFAGLDPDDEIRMSRDEAAIRVVDAIQNSGWLSGAIGRATNAINGTGLVLQYKPDQSLFSSVAAARDYAKMVELRWASYAGDPYSVDLTGRFKLGQLVTSQVEGWFATGDLVGLIVTKARPGQRITTKFNALPSIRLSAGGPIETQQGVQCDRDGMPVAYNIRMRDMRAGGQDTYVLVQARDSTGRRYVVHAFDGPPQSVRGISPLAPAIKLVGDFSRLWGATLKQALTQAIFAAAITSNVEKTEDLVPMLKSAAEQAVTDLDAMQETGEWDVYMGARADWYGNTSVLDGGQDGKLVHLFPGDDMKFFRSETPNTNFRDMAMLLLLEMSSCLGTTVGEFTNDWKGETYSSSRMAGAYNWPTVLRRREYIATPPYQATFEGWLEENIELGLIPFPGGIDAFVNNRAAACMADWRGPPRPQADEEKSAKANEVKYRNGVITRQMWSADEGVDWEDVDQQLALEQESRVAHKLPPIVTPANQQGGVDPSSDGGDNPPERSR